VTRPAAAVDRVLDGLRWGRAGLADAAAACGQLPAEQRHHVAAELARLDGEIAEIMTACLAPEAKP
jgi:hypothetical protein